MPILQSLSTIALQQVLGEGASALVTLLSNHVNDRGQRVVTALAAATERSWKALEVALAGDSWWEQVKGRLARQEDQAFALQVRAFLEACPLPGLDGRDEVRRRCLEELRQARQAGLLAAGALDPAELAGQLGPAGRAFPQAALASHRAALAQVAGELRGAGYPTVAWLVEQRPASGPPLLGLAVRYFFRRAVETDPELARGLTLTQLDGLTRQQQAGLLSLSAALAQQGKRLESLLGDIRDVVVETNQAAGRIEEELQRQSQQVRDLTQAVREALERHQLTRPELRPRDSLSIRGDAERQLVRRLLEQYRQLPREQQDRLPTLLSGLGKLQVAAGQFADAREGFARAATLTKEPGQGAEAHYNAYRAALEERDWHAALKHLVGAANLDPRRFTPFPSTRYQPERILGAGGFGVAFLCRHRHMKVRVVVKSLLVDDLDRDIENVFGEAQVVTELDDPVFVRFWDCGYVSATSKSRPYLVMDYFDGLPLDEHVRRHGHFAPNDLKAVLRPVAEGLQAAHAKGIFHRDVKPANILVRRDETRWRVKLIDFGLAWKQSTLQDTVRSPAGTERTLTGASIAGTLDYAAPEQMGRLPGVGLGPHSDVYGFGKTCYFALLGTPEPDDTQKAQLPLGWRRFLSECTAHPPNRLPDFGAVLRRLVKLKGQKRAVGKRPRPKGLAPKPELPTPSRLRVACPRCGRQLLVPTVGAGQRLKCSSCSCVFAIRQPSA